MLWLKSGNLQKDKEYYLRFVLPSFSDRIMGVFARVLNPNALLITRMNWRDVQEFDHFIVGVEREQIRQQKRTLSRDEHERTY